MQLIVVLVECEYDENLGLIARTMKNFGFNELRLVNPKADKESPKAKSRAMHSMEILKKARVFNSLERALQDADYSVATTAVSSKRPGQARKALTPKGLAEKFSSTTSKLALVFGRESNGLTNKEIKKCDFVASIPASKEHSVLNISHACAIFFYELHSERKKKLFPAATRTTKKVALKKFSELATANPKVRDKKKVTNCFKRVISRAPATEKELTAITAVLSESLTKIKKRSLKE